jgi:hypothetical protein
MADIFNKITEPGVYDIPEDDYHAHPALSAGGACQLLSEPFESCPALYRYKRDNPQPPSKVFDFGHVAHKLLLGEGGEIVVIDAEDWRKADARDRRDAAHDAGKVPILAADYAKAEDMVRVVRSHPLAGAAFTNGQAERSIFWRDEDTGILCKCRPDFLPNKGTIFANYKTARSAHPSAVARAIKDYGYFLSAAWYLDGVKASGLIERPQYVFVFQEKEPPYLVTVAQLEPAAIEWGHIAARKARQVFRNCTTAKRWPGYADDDVVSIALPGFFEKHMEKCHEMGAFEVAMQFQAPLEDAA